jgi:hypothetical protein
MQARERLPYRRMFSSRASFQKFDQLSGLLALFVGIAADNGFHRSKYPNTLKKITGMTQNTTNRTIGFHPI